MTSKLTLGSHYTYKNILRYCLSPILMMLFISIYGIVDGIFVAKFDCQDAFDGINLIMPVIAIVGGTGFMFGSGGSALASKLLGEKKREEASKVFSMMVLVGFVVGAVFAGGMFHFIDDLVLLMAKVSPNTSDLMIEKATLYGKILICSQPFFITETLFQNFFVVDEKQKVCFFFNLAAGLVNIIFDAIFIAGFKFGVAGAAVATMMGHMVGSIGPIIYFLKHKDDQITLVKPKIDFKVLSKCCLNGVSDFIFNISANIVTILYNIKLLKIIGQSGITSYGVIMYIGFIFISIFIGLIMGMAPVIGYNYGAKNHQELRNVIKKSCIILLVYSSVMVVLQILCRSPLAHLFCDTPELIELSSRALLIYSFCYLLMGINIFITGTFTALNNGLVSGLISLFRCLIFPILCVNLLPKLLGIDGVWFALVATEILSFILSIVFLFGLRKKYKY